MCHPHIRDIVEFIYRQGCKAVIITNATLINNEMAFFLGRFKPELQLTLDGGVENIHDMSRGNGTFKKQDAAIKLLKANLLSNLISCNYQFLIQKRFYDLIDIINYLSNIRSILNVF